MTPDPIREALSDERKAALSIYTPPFKFDHGYIHDSSGHMVGDTSLPDEIRVRGWGRIGYMPNPERLQDEIGQVIADALTAYWAALARPVDQGAAVTDDEALAIYEKTKALVESPGDLGSFKRHIGLFARTILAAPQLPSVDQGAVEVWRIFDGEGGYLYQDDAPTVSQIQWAAKRGRKYEALYAAPQPSGETKS